MKNETLQAMDAEQAKELIHQLIYYNFNWYEPSDMIEYITEGRNLMYDHFMEKWNHFCKQYGADSAMLHFYCSLSSTYNERFLTYIFNLLKNNVIKERYAIS